MKYLFLIAIIFSSCSIEKRLYRPGYYISSNSKVILKTKSKTKKVDSKNLEKGKPTSIAKVEQNKNLDKFNEQRFVSINIKKEVINLSKKPRKDRSLNDKKNDQETYSALKKSSKTYVEKKPIEDFKINEPWSELALLFGILSLVLVGCIPALITGAIARKAHHETPNVFGNKWMASIGYVLGLFVTSLVGLSFLFSLILNPSAILIVGFLLCLAALLAAAVILF
ncbi:MAG: DUF4190 domain-containing protein [Flavobacteriales bacterium]